MQAEYYADNYLRVYLNVFYLLRVRNHSVWMLKGRGAFSPLLQGIWTVHFLCIALLSVLSLTISPLRAVLFWGSKKVRMPLQSGSCLPWEEGFGSCFSLYLFGKENMSAVYLNSGDTAWFGGNEFPLELGNPRFRCSQEDEESRMDFPRHWREL